MAENKQNNSTTSYESILKDASKQKKNIYGLRKIFPALIVFIVMMAATYGVWVLTTNQVESDRQAQFEKAVNSVMTRLENKEQKKIEVISSMSGLYDILVQVVKDYFELYATVPIKTYPSIISLIYAPSVSHENLPMFLFNARAQGYYEYNLHPNDKRLIYYPTEHIIPFQPNEHRLGFDFASDDIIKNTIIEARDNNKILASPFYNVRPDTLGFYIIAPIYMKDSSRTDKISRRNNFQGSVIMEIQANTFFKKALAGGRGKNAESAFPSDSTILFRIIDKNLNGDDVVVYESNNYKLLETGYQPFIKSIIPLNIAGRTLNVEFYTVPNFGGSFQASLPILSTITSFVLGLLFFGFVLSVVTSRARAMDLADRMTRSQRRIVEASKDVIAVMTFDGNWKSMNPASEEIFGYTPEEMIGQNIHNLFYDDESRQEFETTLDKSSKEEHTQRINVKMKNVRKELKWMSWSLTVSPNDQLIYSIGRDVTLAKIAEEEARKKAKQIQLAELYAREASQTKSYFMTKLSHSLRNSLTGIIGYLQLLANKVYETEAEHDNFVLLAEESSEEIFTFVADIIDATLATDSEKSTVLETIRLESPFNKAKSELEKKFPEIKFDYTFENGSLESAMIADNEVLADTLIRIFKAFSSGMDNAQFMIQAQENTYEGVTEIQIMGPGNALVAEMIEIYKYNNTKLVEALNMDKSDIILELASAASNIRRMNGTITVESFGGIEGNLAMLYIPLT